MIVKGSNEPIMIVFEDSIRGVSEFSISLFDDNHNLLKHWSRADMTFDENDESIAYAPLLEAETLAFPACVASLEIRWSDVNGDITPIAHVSRIRIAQRYDTTTITDPQVSSEEA